MPITEGLYLGVIGLPASSESITNLANGTNVPEGLWVLRIQILEVRVEATLGWFKARVAADAAEKLGRGETLFLLRPAGSTTAQMQAAPGWAPLVDYRDSHLGRTPNLLAQRAKSTENLKRISSAMLRFCDTHNCFPPAVVYGPDGKPWHSWRVLILPYLKQTTLYEQYRLDEPWDGPNNKKLLAMKPDCYHDPVYGPARDIHAHYAVAVGPGCAFRTEPRNSLDFLPNPPGLTGATTVLPSFRDGTSSTIAVGSISPAAKVPWTKPEDITFHDNLPPPGGIDSFAAPYRTQLGESGMFAFADSASRLLSSDIDPDVFRKLLLIDDGHSVSLETPKPATIAFLDMSTGGGRNAAKLIVEPIPRGDGEEAVRPIVRRIPTAPTAPATRKTVKHTFSTNAAAAWIVRLGGKYTIDREQPSRPIVEVHLGRSAVRDEGLPYLRDQTQLRKLNLWHTQITDTGLRHLVELTQLQELYLRDTAVTDDGLSHIQTLKQLKRLGLADTGVTNVGLAKLAGLTQLEGLFLANTKITGAGLELIKTLPRLSALELRGTELTDVDLRHLTELNSLHSLSLESTRVTDAGLVHLEQLRQLRILRLADTNVTKSGAEKLKKKLPSLQIIGVSEH
jgi:hypothetical protein